ncbi:MAG: ABC transporter permease [Candidatus Binatia bacterium]
MSLGSAVKDRSAASATLAAADTLAPIDRTPTMVVRPRTGWQTTDLRELWRFRDLLWFLALRDIQIRYKQTALGVLWAVLQPVVSVVVLTIIFGHFLGVAGTVPPVNGKDVPYPVFLFAGQLPWTLFAAAVTASSNSLIGNADILRKVYFPRILMPLAALGAPLLDYVLAFAVFLGVMLWFNVVPGWALLLTPLLLAFTLINVLGVGILLAALNVSYRDFKYVVPFMLQLWFFVTPVIYPVKILPDAWSWLLYLNPMVGPIEAFRAVVLGSELILTRILISTAIGALGLLIGAAYFGRVERRFADIA